MIKVRRALVSVSDKSGLLSFVRVLERLQVEIISTGGTARFLRKSGVRVKEISELTGFPEILDGRVKTLHPAIHAGLLALREDEDHQRQLKQLNIDPIDMVVVNLYPFDKVVQRKSCLLKEALENIDVGGPTMIRAAAKNFTSVAVVCYPQQYEKIADELTRNSGILSDHVLRGLAVEAFGYTAQYDQKIFDYLNSRLQSADRSDFPRHLTLTFEKVQDLRYGENPHQAAAFYRERSGTVGLAAIEQRQGKELSFNNFLDLQAAWRIVRAFQEPAACIVKHGNPTGVALAPSLARAFVEAWSVDKVAAFGGIIGCNQRVDEETAQRILKAGFMECVIAPAFTAKALKLFAQKKNFRVVAMPASRSSAVRQYDFRQVDGGLLYQEADQAPVDPAAWKVVSVKKPTPSQMKAMIFGWRLIRYVRSNAVLLVKGQKTLGIGCGQTSRVESTRQALERAGKHARGAVMVSDAFIPKTDNVDLAAEAGVKAIVQSGGSIADQDVIAAADKNKMVMVMTGQRHFLH